jgi:hypothetical protein
MKLGVIRPRNDSAGSPRLIRWTDFVNPAGGSVFVFFSDAGGPEPGSTTVVPLSAEWPRLLEAQFSWLKLCEAHAEPVGAEAVLWDSDNPAESAFGHILSLDRWLSLQPGLTSSAIRHCLIDVVEQDLELEATPAPIALPWSVPARDSQLNVFKTREAALAILAEASQAEFVPPAVRQAACDVLQQEAGLRALQASAGTPGSRLVVIEGLDGTGKSSVSR